MGYLNNGKIISHFKELCYKRCHIKRKLLFLVIIYPKKRIYHLNGCWNVTAELLIMLQSVEAKFKKNSIRHSHWEDPHVPLIFLFFNFLGFRPRNWMEILFKPALVYQLLVNIRSSVDSNYALHFEQREEIKWCISPYIHIFIHLLPLLTMKLWLTRNGHHYSCKFRMSSLLLRP